MRVPNQPVEDILQQNIAALQKAAEKGEKLEIGTLTNGLAVTKGGQLTAGPQKTMQKVSSFCNKLFSKLNIVLPYQQRAQEKVLAFVGKHADPYQQELQSKVLEIIRDSPELSKAFHAILDIQNYHPDTSTEDLNRLKAGTNFDQGALPPRTAAQQEAVTNMQTVLKRAVVDWIIEGHGTNNDALASVLTRTGYSEPMDLPTLSAQLPLLYPEIPPQKIASMQQKLMANWLNLEVGHEWGIALTFSSGDQRVTTEGAYSAVTTGKAALLVSDFVGTGEADSLLTPDSQGRVKRAALAGSEAAHSTHNNYNSSFAGLSSPGANRSTGDRLLQELNANGIVTIPSGWSRHAVGMTLHKAADGKYFLYYCNRGGRAFESSEDRALMGNQKKNSFNMVCFEIEDPSALTPELLGQITGAGFYDTNEAKKDAFAKPFIEGKDGIHKLLKLKKVAEIPKTPQKVGNCSWANCKGSIHAALIAAAYDEACKTDPPTQAPLTTAVATGTKVFKSMERFGRKEGLKPLLAYNAFESGAPISAFDHLRSLSAAARKLDQKVRETRNTDQTRNEDRSMRAQISDYFKACPYPVSALNHQLLPAAKARLLAEVEKSGNGSYALVNGECHAVIDGKLQNLGEMALNQKLSEFLALHPTLTHPIFLDQPRLSTIQNTFIEIGQNLKTNLDQRVKNKTLSLAIDRAKARLRDPKSTFEDKEAAKVALSELLPAIQKEKTRESLKEEFMQILNIEIPGVDLSLKESITQASKEFTETRLKLEKEIADQKKILENKEASPSDQLLAKANLAKLNLSLSTAKAKYDLKRVVFEKRLAAKNSFSSSQAKTLVSLLGKAGELVVLSNLNTLTPRDISRFQNLLDDSYQAFPPAQTPPPYTPPSGSPMNG